MRIVNLQDWEYNVNRKQKFLAILQTGVLIYCVQHRRTVEFGLSVMASACELPDSSIPVDLLGAASEFLFWKAGDAEEPRWNNDR